MRSVAAGLLLLAVLGCTREYPNQSESLKLQAQSAHSAFVTNEGRMGMFYVLKQCPGLNREFAQGDFDSTLGFSLVKATKENVYGGERCSDARCEKFNWITYYRFQLRRDPADSFANTYEIAMSTGRPNGFTVNHPELLESCGQPAQTGEVFVAWDHNEKDKK
jgi:hypothetical protein